MRSPTKRFYLLISNDFPLRNLMSAAQVPDLFVPLTATVVFASSGCSASAAAAIAPANLRPAMQFKSGRCGANKVAVEIPLRPHAAPARHSVRNLGKGPQRQERVRRILHST
jgi:hypothetical protein